MSFEMDLKKGKMVEYWVSNLLKNNFKADCIVTKGNFPFDIIATYADKTMTIEVKFQDTFKTTGNFAYEIVNMQQFMQSGVLATRASHWVDVYQHQNALYALLHRTEDLKVMLKEAMKKRECRIVNGGDFNSSVMILLNKDFIKTRVDINKQTIGAIDEQEILKIC